jgi:8-oxo-dGTP pyrophosphatase MutT (NUDIX family)
MDANSTFVRLSSLRKLREPQQVAAVCYRVRKQEIEFLLIQTRGSGRWTFPKGSAEAGLTHAQAAALEAFEEAGVHGRIEEAAFAQYFCRKQAAIRRAGANSGKDKLAVSAHLCEVMRLRTPKESNRNRTWFSAQDARQRLREDRTKAEGVEFARVVDRAVAGIQRQRDSGRLADTQSGVQINQQPNFYQNDAGKTDPLRRVQLEAPAETRPSATSLHPYMQRQLAVAGRFTGTAVAPRRAVLQGEVLQFVSAQSHQNSKLLAARKPVKTLRARDI